MILGALATPVAVAVLASAATTWMIGLIRATEVLTMLQAANVTKTFGTGNTEVTAVDDVSLTVGHGEFVAVAGAGPR